MNEDEQDFNLTGTKKKNLYNKEYLNMKEDQSSKEGEKKLFETINIITKIQNRFEESIRQNKKPMNEINNLINNKTKINNYLPLNKKQKDNILNDANNSSLLRIQNYNTVFNYIYNCLNDIHNSLGNLIISKDNDYISHNINLNNNVNIIINIDNKIKRKYFHNFSMNNIFSNKKLRFKNTKDLIEPRQKSNDLMRRQKNKELKLNENKNNIEIDNNNNNTIKKIDDSLSDCCENKREYVDFVKNINYPKSNNNILKEQKLNKIFTNKIKDKNNRSTSNEQKSSFVNKQLFEALNQSQKENHKMKLNNKSIKKNCAKLNKNINIKKNKYRVLKK